MRCFKLAKNEGKLDAIQGRFLVGARKTAAASRGNLQAGAIHSDLEVLPSTFSHTQRTALVLLATSFEFPSELRSAVPDLKISNNTVRSRFFKLAKK